MTPTLRGTIMAAAIAWAAAAPAVAQQPSPPAPKPERSWGANARTRIALGYDDNPFLLSPGQAEKLRAAGIFDPTGRFTDMESVGDQIPSAGLEVVFSGPGARGRTLELSGGFVFETNLQSGRRRHADLTFGIEQSLPHAGRLRLKADWRPSYFWKNYLAEAVDVSGDGNIADGERLYLPGTSGEVDLTLNFRRRVAKRVRGEVEAGYFTRNYDAPFEGRDRRGPGAAAGLEVSLGGHSTLGLNYGYQSLAADVTREVLILDETEFGVDFNGTNGVADTSARAFELVDRSRTEQNIAVSVETQGEAGATLRLAYGRRMRAFSSTEPYDVSDRGRHDTRDEVEAELGMRIAHGMRLIVGATIARQKTNRAGDPGATGEVTDYTRHTVTAALAYRF